MILSKRIALGGIQLDQVNSAVVIRSIDPGVPKESIGAVDLMGGFGQRVTNQHWETLEVSVTYAIDIPKKQMAARRTVFDAVNRWALAKGWLTVNWMTGKRMWVDKVVIPGSGDLWNWTDEHVITFRAYGVPFWQDDTATTNSGASITVPGMMTTVCDAELTNNSGSTIDSLTVQIGNSSMSFGGLSLEDGHRLVIGHENNGLLYIRKYTSQDIYTSVMDKRTGGSADDLYTEPGANAITVSGNGVTASVSCFGRYV